MANIGERLTEARKNFGIDIRSAAEATKIRSDFLAALEENKPERIKLADVYKVGFLRIYAKYLKLDADRIVAEFRTNLSFHGASSKGGHRPVSGGESVSGGNAAGTDTKSVFSGGGTGFSPEKLLSTGGGRIAVAVVVILLVAVCVFAAMKIFGSDDSLSESTSAVVLSTPETQTYEFQIISKVPQTVTITDCYGSSAGSRAKVLDNVQISENRPMILRARGVLEIRDAGNQNLEVRFPSREALVSATNANEAVKFTEADKASSPFRNAGNWWIADPYSLER